MATADTSAISKCDSKNQDGGQQLENEISLTRDLYDDVDMALSRLRRKHIVDFPCRAELGCVVELRDLRCFLIWDGNLHFPEAEVAGRNMVKSRLLLLLDDVLERTDRLFSIYFHLEGFCIQVIVDEAEESDGRRCPGMIEVR